MVKRRYNCDIDWDLTSKQKRVLDWLFKNCGHKETKIICAYRRIGKDLGITRKAVKERVATLKKKGLVLSKVYCSRGSKKPSGLLIRITAVALGKYFPHDFTVTPIKENEMEDWARKEAQAWDQMKKKARKVNSAG